MSLSYGKLHCGTVQLSASPRHQLKPIGAAQKFWYCWLFATNSPSMYFRGTIHPSAIMHESRQRQLQAYDGVWPSATPLGMNIIMKGQMTSMLHTCRSVPTLGCTRTLWQDLEVRVYVRVSVPFQATSSWPSCAFGWEDEAWFATLCYLDLDRDSGCV
jgi:hypothetical protein